MERVSEKGKGLMDMDNSVVIVGVGTYRGVKGNEKKCNQSINHSINK